MRLSIQKKRIKVKTKKVKEWLRSCIKLKINSRKTKKNGKEKQKKKRRRNYLRETSRRRKV